MTIATAKIKLDKWAEANADLVLEYWQKNPIPVIWNFHQENVVGMVTRVERLDNGDIRVFFKLNEKGESVAKHMGVDVASVSAIIDDIHQYSEISMIQPDRLEDDNVKTNA